jgi:2-haloacid dehalogenase
MTAIVFDVGNVLIRWEPRLVWADDFGGPAELDAFMAEIGFAAWNLEQDRGRSWADGVATACAAHPHRRALIEKFHRDWHRAVPGTIGGAVEVLDKLRAAGVPLYAITNFSAEKWAECRGRFPFLGSAFRDVVVSAHERVVKPDPAIFELFLARNGLSAEDCIYVDDSPPNVAMAEILGFDAILFDEPVSLAGKLRVRGLPL